MAIAALFAELLCEMLCERIQWETEGNSAMRYSFHLMSWVPLYTNACGNVLRWIQVLRKDGFASDGYSKTYAYANVILKLRLSLHLAQDVQSSSPAHQPSVRLCSAQPNKPATACQCVFILRHEVCFRLDTGKQVAIVLHTLL